MRWSKTPTITTVINRSINPPCPSRVGGKERIVITKEWMDKNEWFVSMFTHEEWASMSDQEIRDGLEEARDEEKSERFMDMGDDERAEMAYHEHRDGKAILKLCIVCGEIRRMQPEYDKCDGCVWDLENGRDPIGARA